MTRVENEVAFGLENLGVAPEQIWPRVEPALGRGRRDALCSGDGRSSSRAGSCSVSASPRRSRSSRSCSCSTSRRRSSTQAVPRRFSPRSSRRSCAVVLCEQRVDRALAIADRVIMMEEGRIVLDAPVAEARAWLVGGAAAVRGRARPESTRSRPRHGPHARSSAFDGVRFAYGDGPEVLGGHSLIVRPGEIVALEGANGSGKTTLAKIAAGLLQPTSGTVERAGPRDVPLTGSGPLPRLRDRCSTRSRSEWAATRRAPRLLSSASGSRSLRDRHPRDLSSGERERLGIAAVSVPEPDLLVLDEPTRGIDPDRKAALAAWLARAGRGRSWRSRRHPRPARCRPTAGCGSTRPWRCPLRSRLALAAFVASGSRASLWAVLDPAHGGLATLLAAFALVAGGFAWLEQGGDTARDLTLVATLGGIAAAGRVLFAPIPNVQPVTVIVAAAGVALGPRRGIRRRGAGRDRVEHVPRARAAHAVADARLGRLRCARGRLRLRACGGAGRFALFCAVLGLAFGTVMDLWLWFAFYPHTWAALVTVLAAEGSPSTSPTRSAISCWRSSPGRSCGACSTGTGAARTRRWCGRESWSLRSWSLRSCSRARRRDSEARCRVGGLPRRSPERERRLRRAGAHTGRAADCLGGARPRRRAASLPRRERGRSHSSGEHAEISDRRRPRSPRRRARCARRHGRRDAARAAAPTPAGCARQRNDLDRARAPFRRGATSAAARPGDPGDAGEGRWIRLVARGQRRTRTTRPRRSRRSASAGVGGAPIRRAVRRCGAFRTATAASR